MTCPILAITRKYILSHAPYCDTPHFVTCPILAIARSYILWHANFVLHPKGCQVPTTVSFLRNCVALLYSSLILPANWPFFVIYCPEVYSLVQCRGTFYCRRAVRQSPNPVWATHTFLREKVLFFQENIILCQGTRGLNYCFIIYW